MALLDGACGPGQFSDGSVRRPQAMALRDKVSATIEPGQMLVLYTDGVTEAMNPSGEEYGGQRLVAAALRGRHLSARELIDFIHRDVIDWTGGRGAHDDVTFFIIKAL